MKTRQDFILFVGAIFILFNACSTATSSQKEMISKTEIEEEKYRPRFHFTPENNWMNDPNGMFYLSGTFHLYFQHHPESNVWGPMHWGHATSEDLLNWKERPIALYPDDLGTIFSGSAVVDFQNTSGLGSLENPPIVAIYTNHDAEAAEGGSERFQTQGIAYSLDEGHSWTKYKNNPVIENPGIRDFRDPKVFWMDSQKKWILTLAAGQETQFFSSLNLIEWTFLSSFGKGIGNHEGVWECPDLFELKVNGSEETKWVHLVSINPGGPNGGSATQYFVGDFDGTNFTLDPNFKTEMEKAHHFWTDFGKDNYAGVTFSNWKDQKGNPLFLGWMSNWQYATKAPTYKWRSSMTLARTLELFKTVNGFRLKSSLFMDSEKVTAKKVKIKETTIGEGKMIVDENGINLASTKMKVVLKNIEENTYTFVLANQAGDTLLFGYDHRQKQFFIDRSKSGAVDFSEDFSDKPSLAPRFGMNDELHLEFVLDKTSIELFYDEGETAMTEIFFPHKPFETLSLLANESTKTVFSGELVELDVKKTE